MPNLAETLVQIRMQAGDDKIPESQAGYMELEGAVKDGGCRKVNVAGGVSKELGCCNYFVPANQKVKRFHCKDCEFLA